MESGASQVEREVELSVTIGGKRVTGWMIVVFVILSGINHSGTGALPPGAPIRVLFVGNSLTFANDMPALVEAISALPGRRKMRCRSQVAGGFSLEDHWIGGEIQQLLSRERFDFVVLQQGPSSLAESRANLRAFAPRFASLIRKNGATPAFYMVWPEFARIRVLPDVAKSYRLAAKDVGGILLPAGEAWQAAWNIYPKADLYGPDQFHPSEKGSLLAALVVYRGLSGDRDARLPEALKISAPPLKVVQVTVHEQSVLNAAADAVLKPANPVGIAIPRRIALGCKAAVGLASSSLARS